MFKSAKLLLILLALTATNAIAGDIRIGIYSDLRVESVVFSVTEGEYVLMADGKEIARITKNSMFYIEREGNFISVIDTGHSFGLFTSLTFLPGSANGIFQVKAVLPAAPSKECDEKLEIFIKEGNIHLINTLGIDKYIPGTVESEGGSGSLPEYYKAQAVLARTYAIRNFYRHAQEGFNLCDGVHCQAYNGKSRMNREIYLASEATKEQILTDQAGQPVITAYHANCGGITGSSGTIWNRDLYYLQPVNDPFCDKSTYRNWTKSISRLQWTAYLNSKGFTDDPVRTFSQEAGRQKFLANGMIDLADIRRDFGLKSAYFHVEGSSNSVVFVGHGYGHGLGMCQQGAMEMARKGYTYVDILMFYFRKVQLTNFVK
jgi:stage II sporulation protein D